MRFAIYFTPERKHRLTQAAANWLGRDAFGGPVGPRGPVAELTAEAIERLTEPPRRYGFHATLKAPFTLAEGATVAALDEALAAFAARTAPIALGRLRLAQIDGFFALVEQGPLPQLQELAGEIVSHFEPFRAATTAAEIARRRPDLLTERERANLMRWGYPYVFDTFQFHMTLTGRVPGPQALAVRHALETVFGDVLDKPVDLDGLGLFVETEAGAPFVVQSYHPFQGRLAVSPRK